MIKKEYLIKKLVIIQNGCNLVLILILFCLFFVFDIAFF